MKKSKPSLMASLLPAFFLVILLILSVRIYGNNSLDGANQITLLIASAICVGLSFAIKSATWKEMESGIVHNIANSTSSIVILLLIGALSGAWMMSGIVPAMIYYGLKLINPTIFLAAACFLSAIVSLACGSSWTTVATIGVAMSGIGQVMGYSEAWIAGAIISGAYFGDKISPLSDTTNLASAMSGTPLFTHVHYMLYTTIPSITISLLLFLFFGFFNTPQSALDVSAFADALDAHFHISLWLFVVPLITCVMIVQKIPAIITLFVSAFLGAVMALVFQPQICAQIVGDGFNSVESNLRAFMQILYGKTSIQTGNDLLNELVATRGMAGMLNTIWLILCAMVFGGVMEASGMLGVITDSLVQRMKTMFSTVAATTFAGVFFNLTTSDQYLSIIIPSKMFSSTYQKNGLESRLLSRTIEDSATVISVLIPWNTCGMTQAMVLGIPTLTYLPYCFFNIISPLMTLFMAAIGYKIKQTTNLPVQNQA